jgi:hypothetical protein
MKTSLIIAAVLVLELFVIIGVSALLRWIV